MHANHTPPLTRRSSPVSLAAKTLPLPLILLLLPVVTAQTGPEPPESISLDVINTGTVNDVQFATLRFAWVQSTDDLDGDYNYSVYNGSAPDILNLSFFLTIPPAVHDPVTDRDTWLNDGDLQPAITFAAGPSQYLTLTTLDNGDEGGFACILLVLPVIGWHDQCGNNGTLLPSPGTNAIVTAVTKSGSDVSSVNNTFRALLSPDDFTSREFNYSRYYQFSNGTVGLRTEIPTQDTNRRLIHNETLVFPHQYSYRSFVIARDPLTYRVSPESCSVTVRLDMLYSQDSCGTIGAPGTGQTFTAVGAPFTGSLTETATSLGTTETGALALYGVIILGLTVGFGIYVAGGPGGIILGSLGLGFTTLAGLLPVWLLVVTFLAGITAIVVRNVGNGSGG